MGGGEEKSEEQRDGWMIGREGGREGGEHAFVGDSVYVYNEINTCEGYMVMHISVV